MNGKLLTVEEVAARLALARGTVYGMTQRGGLPVVRIGRAVRVPEEALARWVAERTSAVEARGAVG